LGASAAAGVLTLIPGALVIYFVRNYIARLRPGEGVIMNLDFTWMAWTWRP